MNQKHIFLADICHSLSENTYKFYFHTGEFLELNSETIELISDQYWNQYKAAYNSLENKYQTRKCGFCLKQYENICDAIKPPSPG